MKKQEKQNLLMSIPSGNYTAQISSQFYCFGDNDCGGVNQNLSWACTSEACDSFNLSGQIPKPKYTIGVDSPIIKITMPQIPGNSKWTSAVGTLTNSGNDCAQGQVSFVNNQEISFKIAGSAPPICENTILSASIQSGSGCHLKCHPIPYTDWAWCYKNHADQGAFIRI